MLVRICDRCKSEVTNLNFGKKYARFTKGEFSIVIKAGSVADVFGESTDLCLNCILEILDTGIEDKKFSKKKDDKVYAPMGLEGGRK